jgi:alkylhydroperoxidase family enzyme
MVMTNRLETLAAAVMHLRRAIHAAAAPASGRAVAEYTALVRDQSYRITDAHVETLRNEGLSDDAIFELTVASAFSLAEDRLATGLALLDLPDAAAP